jgi:hypothetical protein
MSRVEGEAPGHGFGHDDDDDDDDDVTGNDTHDFFCSLNTCFAMNPII